MNNTVTTINVNVDSKIKEEATNVLKNLGLNMSTAINMFLVQVIKTEGIPFEVKNNTYNMNLVEAMAELQYIKEHPEEYKKYKTREDLKKSLLDD